MFTRLTEAWRQNGRHLVGPPSQCNVSAKHSWQVAIQTESTRSSPRELSLSQEAAQFIPVHHELCEILFSH